MGNAEYMGACVLFVSNVVCIKLQKILEILNNV